MIRSLACLLALLCVPALLAAPAPPAKAVNLLVNGSFEEGPETDLFKPLDADSTEIKGWTVTRGQIDYLHKWCKAADGAHALDLSGSPGIGGVKQTFKTTKGQKYKVSFALAANPTTATPKKKLGVSAAGKETSFEFDGTGKTTDDLGWETKTWEFTATDKETTLEFYNLSDDDNLAGPLLDNVAVVAVEK